MGEEGVGLPAPSLPRLIDCIPCIAAESMEGWSAFLKLRSLTAWPAVGDIAPYMSNFCSSPPSIEMFLPCLFFVSVFDLNFEIGIELQMECSSRASSILGESALSSDYIFSSSAAPPFNRLISSVGSFLLIAYFISCYPLAGRAASLFIYGESGRTLLILGEARVFLVTSRKFILPGDMSALPIEFNAVTWPPGDISEIAYAPNPF